MTIQEAIAAIDEQKPNTVPAASKLRWLGELDWEIYRDVLLTHEGNVPEFTGYPQDMSQEDRKTTVLLAPAPYDSMYLYCLESHIDYENGETGRVNNSNAMFRAVFDAYRNWYNRTHRPLARAVRFY